jgi:hypothetical protein
MPTKVKGRSVRALLAGSCVLLALFPSVALSVPRIPSTFTRPPGPLAAWLDLLQTPDQAQLGELRVHKTFRAIRGKQPASPSCLPFGGAPLAELRAGLLPIPHTGPANPCSISSRHVNDRAPPLVMIPTSVQ